ncbi:hypothetical protein DL89DRAFT_128100 [Linderina pennispora]|uniref:Uncharacterized protein n=1 Tax=Linderina pennispora TaxID=61395 RepID=A0A1Y1WDC4_9FUNG|nr:uncharacterized protein DL89DRAFT_128100 [Linderina pennispora]ORX71540.1 hypothetical protein DL89DRAFT_128100 [Linderina pennispora]
MLPILTSVFLERIRRDCEGLSHVGQAPSDCRSRHSREEGAFVHRDCGHTDSIKRQIWELQDGNIVLQTGSSCTGSAQILCTTEPGSARYTRCFHNQHRCSWELHARQLAVRTTQWAAVTTWFLEIIVPPHFDRLPSEYTVLIIDANGYLLTGATLPPTMRLASRMLGIFIQTGLRDAKSSGCKSNPESDQKTS